MITGREAEELFAKVMRDQGKEVRRATKKEDMFDHIDFFVDDVSYDVKGHKKAERSDLDKSDRIYLEFINVHGRDGWLNGKAEYIAFLVENEFWVTNRVELLNYINKSLVSQKIFDNDKMYKKLYRRRFRKDVMTYVYPRDIKHLVVKKYKI
jgi:hypothetical protein